METFARRRKQCFQFLFVLAFTVGTMESSKMKISGKVSVPGLKEGVSLAKDSHLVVKFEDTSKMDSSAVLLGKQEQAISEGTKVGRSAEPFNYTIICDKPQQLAPFYSVSAVLNVGWKASGDEWLRKGDFFTDTTHEVHLSEDSDDVVADIEMVLYQH